MGMRLAATFWVGLLGVVAGAFLVWGLIRGGESQFQWPVAQVVAKVNPSVVMVVNHEGRPPQEKVKGIGSGVIIDQAGDIVTNYHVIAGASRVTVQLADGSSYPAVVVGADPPTDLAVVRIRSTRPLVPITFASSGQIRPGDLVVAIGNSLGLRHSVTVGVVSAKERVLYRDGWEFHLIQTDAAINPGNSGGPLLNLQGQLIGINSSKIAQAGVEGIGFAIPSDVVRTVATQLIRYGQVRRPWLGITVATARPGDVGLFVVAVAPGGPAARAGIRPGDFVTALGSHPLHTVADLRRTLTRLDVGETVVVRFWRAGEAQSAPLVVGQTPIPSGAGTSPRQAG
ncbi:MAG: trypsin-like peptidase domain-containing protein [Firmicutes bacterium]|nr:trypsin-like peptidase domain-containing protein [Alicyclobacillaceae bacterium]MCL6496160.1 trypsin-like peptidase domain-containing protein [Bacillota bacterium]